MIVSLDPSSTRVGYAISNAGKLDAGVLVPRPHSPDPMVRIRVLADDIRAFPEIREAELVLIESPPKAMHGKGNSILIQWAAYGAFRLVLADMGVKRLRAIDPSTWTRGRHKETWAFDIRRRFGLSEANDPGADAAAAVGILDWWMRIGRQREVLTA